MESNKQILILIEKFKKNTGNDPQRVLEELEHWYNCKHEIDDGASGEEHTLYKSLKELINGLFNINS